MTKLGIARIVGECGVTGGCITSSTYAVKYGKEIVAVREAKSQAENRKSDYSNVTHGLGMTQYLINNYFLSKQSVAAAPIKEQLEKFNSCLHSYLADTGDRNCISNNYGLNDKLQQLGVNFS